MKELLAALDRPSAEDTLRTSERANTSTVDIAKQERDDHGRFSSSGSGAGDGSHESAAKVHDAAASAHDFAAKDPSAEHTAAALRASQAAHLATGRTGDGQLVEERHTSLQSAQEAYHAVREDRSVGAKEAHLSAAQDHRGMAAEHRIAAHQ